MKPALSVRAKNWTYRNSPTICGIRLRAVSTCAWSSVVDQAHLHVSLKNTCLDGNPRRTQRSDQILIQLIGKLRRRSLVKTWPPAFAAISVQRELRDHQRRAANIQQAAIHLTGVIRKNA